MRYLIFLTMLITTKSTPASGEGGVTSSGGDSVAAEFTVTARHIAEILKKETGLGILSRDFLATVNSTLVVSRMKVVLNGYERDAINYPEIKKIVISRNRWFETANQIGRRYMLVMHEYLSVMGINDTNYQISSKLFRANGKMRFEIVCSAFDDLTEHFGERYELYYTSYEDREVSVVKNSNGAIPTHPIGHILASAISLDNGESALLFVVNFGIIRNIQVPYSFLNGKTGTIKAKTWDTKADGKSAKLETVNCEARSG